MIDINEPVEFDTGERVVEITKNGSGFRVKMDTGQHPYRDGHLPRGEDAGYHQGQTYFYTEEGVFGGGTKKAFKYLVNAKFNPADFEFDV